MCDVYGGWWCGNINYGLLTIDYDGKPGPAEAGQQTSCTFHNITDKNRLSIVPTDRVLVTSSLE